ncbi:MAG TPA: hypothetical protein VLW85_00575 [Myxococcales bacterium]|nr:hypothetical protein [Myxococcales bacterium]
MTRKILAVIAGACFLAGASMAQDNDAQRQPRKHHSLAKGAAGGAVGGHFVGKGHAKAGAAAGALYQHHKNKKEEKAAKKQQ